RWEGVIYRVDRKPIASGLRAARVQVERRLDGNLWMHWRTQILPLERCEAKAREPRQSPVRKPRAAPVRSARREHGPNSEFSMPAGACQKLTHSWPIDRSGRP